MTPERRLSLLGREARKCPGWNAAAFWPTISGPNDRPNHAAKFEELLGILEGAGDRGQEALDRFEITVGRLAELREQRAGRLRSRAAGRMAR